MFKNGEGYDLVAKQGAGAYLGGTTTANPKPGNNKNNIARPFVPYPASHAASNWLGLPNEGDERVARRVERIQKIEGCPLGMSIAASPDLEPQKALESLVDGMHRYRTAGVDFLEVNQSCPNTGEREQQEGLAQRLHYIKKEFLDKRTDRAKYVPVIVKFSTDTSLEQLPKLLEMVIEAGFDGINLGNSSTAYDMIENIIHSSEKKLFGYFTKTFGGGVTGAPLKYRSFDLAKAAVEYLKKNPPPQEFHVIRTGGISSSSDFLTSERNGIALNQWFTGYFEKFAQYGHDLYWCLYSLYAIDKTRMMTIGNSPTTIFK